jgi:hypothetical protein
VAEWNAADKREDQMKYYVKIGDATTRKEMISIVLDEALLGTTIESFINKGMSFLMGGGQNAASQSGWPEVSDDMVAALFGENAASEIRDAAKKAHKPE